MIPKAYLELLHCSNIPVGYCLFFFIILTPRQKGILILKTETCFLPSRGLHTWQTDAATLIYS